MNLVENYIVEVLNEVDSKRHPGYVCVELVTDCYGCVRRSVHFTSKEQWEKEKEQGYYLA